MRHETAFKTKGYRFLYDGLRYISYPIPWVQLQIRYHLQAYDWKPSRIRTMGDRTAFFYGTLMAREILYRVCYGSFQVGNDPATAQLAASLTIQPAILHSFCRHRVQDADYPGIIPDAGHMVLGTYVTGLTDGDIFRLDRFEGSEYTRQKVEVEVLKKKGDKAGDGEMFQAETYVYTAGDQFLEKKEWDFEEFRREKMSRWTGESHEYDEVDEVDQVTLGDEAYQEKDEELIRKAV